MEKTREHSSFQEYMFVDKLEGFKYILLPRTFSKRGNKKIFKAPLKHSFAAEKRYKEFGFIYNFTGSSINAVY